MPEHMYRRIAYAILVLLSLAVSILPITASAQEATVVGHFDLSNVAKTSPSGQGDIVVPVHWSSPVTVSKLSCTLHTPRGTVDWSAPTAFRALDTQIILAYPPSYAGSLFGGYRSWGEGKVTIASCSATAQSGEPLSVRIDQTPCMAALGKTIDIQPCDSTQTFVAHQAFTVVDVVSMVLAVVVAVFWALLIVGIWRDPPQ